MYGYESLSLEDKSVVSTPTVDCAVFQDFVTPRLHCADKEPGEESPDRPSEPQSLDELRPDGVTKHMPTGTDNGDSWIQRRLGTGIVEKPGDDRNGALPKPKDAVGLSKPLQAAETIKEYVKDLPKLAFAASGDIDTALELMMICKGSSIKAKEKLVENTSPFVTVPRTEMVFSPSDAADKSWELRVHCLTGEARALRLNAKSLQMEPAEVGPLMEDVSLTLRATMAVKCFRDGDVDAGRGQLKALIEDGRKLGAEERLKKIIETEADLAYKPSRLRALSRADFNKILVETELAVPQRKKR